jgi:hypothetical protein
MCSRLGKAGREVLIFQFYTLHLKEDGNPVILRLYSLGPPIKVVVRVLQNTLEIIFPLDKIKESTTPLIFLPFSLRNPFFTTSWPPYWYMQSVTSFLRL